ncbi:baseplate J/gp47 family protein [Paenibacillus sepulcri]|uniref:Baseplate J/gp47 family protein n=1 Tax=Paenibacillus sepulcri TaxID=359917 RepID=A0ABS7BV11_9BACL|nr:baseplate J/gp47 family protein [Paenibacillus sepulcri]
MLDSTGFKRQRFEDIFASMELKTKEVFGETTNTAEDSPIGLLLRIEAWALAMLWQDAEQVYNNGYINTAIGNNLDRLGPYVGVTRITEQYATGAVTLTGTPGYIVPAGFRVAAGDVYFETDTDIPIGLGGTATVTVTAVNPGQTGNVAAGMIVDIVNPNADVTRVTNPAEIRGGREKETDEEFRDRFEQSVSTGGSGTVDSIRGILLGVAGVRAAVVIENITNATDSAGRPPKSFEAYVLGGSAVDIGAAIFSKKAAGIESYGSESVTVLDLAGNAHEVHFSFAETVTVSIKVTVTKNSSYPADGAAQLKTALIKYIGGEDADGQLYSGLTMGADVVLSRMIATALTIPGVDDAAVELSLDGGSSWFAHNIVTGPQEVAQTAADQITVVVAT